MLCAEDNNTSISNNSVTVINYIHYFLHASRYALYIISIHKTGTQLLNMLTALNKLSVLTYSRPG